MKIDILTLTEDLNRQIEDLQCKIQRDQGILQYLHERFAEIQPEPPDTPTYRLPLSKRDLIKKTGEKLRRPFDIHDVEFYVSQTYPDCPSDFYIRSKIFRDMVNRGELIKVRQGRSGPKSERTNLYELRPSSRPALPTPEPTDSHVENS